MNAVTLQGRAPNSQSECGTDPDEADVVRTQQLSNPGTDAELHETTNPLLVFIYSPQVER